MESPRFENQSDCEDYISWADEEIERLKDEIIALKGIIAKFEDVRNGE